MLLVLLVMLLIGGTHQATNITRTKISSYILPNKTLNIEMDIVMPIAKGNYPAILFLTGLSGIAPEYMYTIFT